MDAASAGGDGAAAAGGEEDGEGVKPPLGWDELLSRFMAERGYALHFPGVNLCRRQGDNATRLATETELAALLRAKK
eukprot:4629901-Prymnesium_polylepis.1